MLSLLLGICAVAAVASDIQDLRQDFADPPLCWKSRPLWFWNAPANEAATASIMAGAREAGYYGFGILPAERCQAFMSAEYLDAYQYALDQAAALGMKMCLYDEYWFPSGSAGGLLAKTYPEALGKRIDKAETDVTGPKPFSQTVPEGQFMGAVAMNMATLARVDISANRHGKTLAWDVPEGLWKVMLFTCVNDGAGGLVDYLDPEAVAKFIALTYQQYYDRFPRHFGTTIDRAFYDEPALYKPEGGRAWTGAFNTKFQERYGFSPIPCYPALWYDIGEETAAARNALFGFRAELYAAGFPKTINEWCRAHHIELTGHVDQEEMANPVGLCGDLLKCFAYQDIPGIDEISVYGRGSKAYKLVSSSAYNYDKRLVMTETYGAMTAMPVAMLYKEAMDQFAKGINAMIPHAVWYDPAHIIFEPELSLRTPPYAAALPEYNRYIGRLQRILQFGGHVADIGVLYPIATLQAGYRFGVGQPYTGGIVPEEADYMDVGEQLALGVRRDFTFIHPEVLATKCSVEGPRIRLNNENNPEEYRVFIVPGSKTIHAGTLRVLKRFYDLGGQIIATTCLPGTSAEFGKDAEVRQLVLDIFGADPGAKENTNDAGGKACFVKTPSAERLQSLLESMQPVPDVRFESVPPVAGGNVTYIHKIIAGRDYYFFANSSNTAAGISVLLRGSLDLEAWDPHTGDIRGAECTPTTEAGVPVTRVQLNLAPVHSIFIVSRTIAPAATR